jgi:chromosome partitioning protein
MIIITVNVNKGGAGKTTFTHNFAEWLKKTHRVLLIDFDDSANLTNRYGHFNQTENTVLSLFDTGFVKPIHVDVNLDLIAGHREVELLKERVNGKRRREYIFGKWLAQNQAYLMENYDYILIDTENDEGVLTQNAIIVSDLVIGLAEASKDSVSALSSLRAFVNDLNADFEEDTQLAFVANKINHTETASKELLKALKRFPDYLGYIPRRTALADEYSIFSSQSELKNKELLSQVETVFQAVVAKVED